MTELQRSAPRLPSPQQRSRQQLPPSGSEPPPVSQSTPARGSKLPAIPLADSPVAPWLDRTIALAVVAVAAAIVWFLATLTPDPRGFGTHEQLGMEPCGWPAQYGIPCPTCGATTAAAHLVHLSPLRAIATQPFGAAAAAAGLWLAGLALVSLLRHRSFVARLSLVPFGTMFGLGVLLLLGSWLYTYLTWPS